MIGRLGALLCVFGTYIFLYVPIVVLTVFSFNQAVFPSPWVGFTWKWYQELYHSTYLWDAFYNSLFIALISMMLSLLMSTTLIFYAAQNERVNRLMTLFYINLFVPEVVLAVGLLAVFKFLNISLGLTSLIVAHTILGIGYVVPLVYSRFLELDYHLTEASLDLGASYFQTFRRVTMPLLTPSLVAAGLLVFVLSFDDFVLSYFCAGSSTQTLSLYILSMLRSGISPVVNALSTLLLFLSSILVLLFCSLHKRSRIF
ncbi:MAG: ABC transporter permease [Candidatus Babeliaceae bacterium]